MMNKTNLIILLLAVAAAIALTVLEHTRPEPIRLDHVEEPAP